MSAATNACPQCGTVLPPGVDRTACPSCAARALARAQGGPAPAARPGQLPPAVRALVLGGAALFLLAGTVLTGYCFAKSLAVGSSRGEETEDWRATLHDLREQVSQPPQALSQGGGEQPVVQEPPQPVKDAIARGVDYLKAHLTGPAAAPLGANALAGLALLECGVPANDSAVQKAVEQVRARAPQLTPTYEIATCIWFLDRLGQRRDRELIRSLALRLIASQMPMGGWGYACQLITPEQEQQLLYLLAANALPSSMEGSPSSVTFEPSPRPRQPPADPTGLKNLPLFQFQPGQALPMRATGHEDNSLTQFAILGLWAARKYDVPVERSLAFVEARVRTYQNADGSWGYILRATLRRDSMTCAGLLGLAVGRGLNLVRTGQAEDVKDEAIEKALRYLGHVVGRKGLRTKTPEQAKQLAEYNALLAELLRTRPAEQPAIRNKIQQLLPAVQPLLGPGNILGADSWGDLYFLWSLERMAVVFDLKTVAGKDWYAWGSELILDAQQPNGSWANAHAGVPDTCFALLFLKRVNVVKDLTARLRLLGKVKDPGRGPVNRLPGEGSRPDSP